MEFSFFEMVLVGLIALLVLGPEELVRKANSIGRWMGKTKAELNNWKIMAQEEILKDRPQLNQIISVEEKDGTEPPKSGDSNHG